VLGSSIRTDREQPNKNDHVVDGALIYQLVGDVAQTRWCAHESTQEDVEDGVLINQHVGDVEDGVIINQHVGDVDDGVLINQLVGDVDDGVLINQLVGDVADGVPNIFPLESYVVRFLNYSYLVWSKCTSQNLKNSKTNFSFHHFKK